MHSCFCLVLFGFIKYSIVLYNRFCFFLKAFNGTGVTFGFRPHLAYRVDGDVFVSKKKSDKLVFTGTFFYNGGGRQLEGRMKTNAVWKKAFGYPQLTIKRMQAG